jgi:hypothetical protein
VGLGNKAKEGNGVRDEVAYTDPRGARQGIYESRIGRGCPD